MINHIPNILTISRIILLPVLIGLFFAPGACAAWAALAIYIFCAVTDFLDGYVARKYNVTSGVGTFLDPISDKIMVVSLLMAMAAFDRLDGIWVVPAIIILSREFFVSGLREYLGPKNVKVPVSQLAKWKTAFQMVALGFLVIGDYGDTVIEHTLLIGQVLLSIAAIITLITGWNYLKAGWKHI